MCGQFLNNIAYIHHPKLHQKNQVTSQAWPGQPRVFLPMHQCLQDLCGPGRKWAGSWSGKIFNIKGIEQTCFVEQEIYTNKNWAVSWILSKNHAKEEGVRKQHWLVTPLAQQWVQLGLVWASLGKLWSQNHHWNPMKTTPKHPHHQPASPKTKDH